MFQRSADQYRIIGSKEQAGLIKGNRLTSAHETNQIYVEISFQKLGIDLSPIPRAVWLDDHLCHIALAQLWGQDVVRLRVRQKPSTKKEDIGVPGNEHRQSDLPQFKHRKAAQPVAHCKLMRHQIGRSPNESAHSAKGSCMRHGHQYETGTGTCSSAYFNEHWNKHRNGCRVINEGGDGADDHHNHNGDCEWELANGVNSRRAM